jgi:hypothetical protein
MPKRLLPFALSALLLPATVLAQEAQESKPPVEAQPAQQAPEKKPDAFQYFFGKKRDVKKAPEAQKAPEAKKPAPAAKAPEAKPAAPAPEVTLEKSVAPVAEDPEPVAPSVPAPAPVPDAPAAASEVRPEPAMVAQPQLAAPAAPEPQAAPEPPKVEEPKGDAFHYFFGQASQPAPETKKEEAEPRKPVKAFDYFFGKDGKADEIEEPQSPPPV